MDSLVPSSMMDLISLAFEMGLGDRSPEEKRKYLAERQDVIHHGIQDALDHVVRPWRWTSNLTRTGPCQEIFLCHALVGPFPPISRLGSFSNC